MNICQHHQKITKFCVNSSCQQKTPGGCQICMKKLHSHIMDSQNNANQKSVLNQLQIIELLKTHSAITSQNKPKCRMLQDAIHNHFTKTKGQINALLDSVDKYLINKIGYPSMFQNEKQFSTFKRLKNKDYKKLNASQFRSLTKELLFIEQVDKIKSDKLANIANKQVDIHQYNIIIQKDIKNYFQSVSGLTGILKQFDSVLEGLKKFGKSLQINWQPQKQDQIYIKQIISQIQNLKNQRHKSQAQQHFIRGYSNNKQQTAQKQQQYPKTARYTSLQKNTLDRKQNDKQHNKQKDKQRLRHVSSIERAVKKQKQEQSNNLKYIKTQIDQTIKEQQKSAKISLYSQKGQCKTKKISESTDPYQFYKNKFNVSPIANNNISKNQSVRVQSLSSTKQQCIKDKKQKIIDMFKKNQIMMPVKQKKVSQQSKLFGQKGFSDLPRQDQKNQANTTVTGKTSEYQKQLYNQQYKFNVLLNKQAQSIQNSPVKNKYKKYESDQSNQISSPAKLINRDSQKSRSDQKDQKVFQSIKIKPINIQIRKCLNQQRNSPKRHIKNMSIVTQDIDYPLKQINNPIIDQRNSQLDHTILPMEQSMDKFQDDTNYTQAEVKRIFYPIKNPINLKKDPQKYESPLLRQRVAKSFTFSPSKQRKVSIQSPILSARSPSPGNKQSRKLAEKDSIQALNNQQNPEYSQKQVRSMEFLLKALSEAPLQAIKNLQYSLMAHQNNLSSVQYLSYLYLQTNQPKQCLNLCNKYLQKVHGRPDGIMQSNTSTMDSDSEVFQASISLNINKSAALNCLGRYSQSIGILQKCLTFIQKDSLFKNLGDAYFSIGITQKALYYYEKALQLCQEYDEAHYNSAVCLYILENYRNAKLSVERALDYAPFNQEYKVLLNHIIQRIR